MLAARALFQKMQSSETRFQALQQSFGMFVAGLSEVIGLRDCPVKGLNIESDSKDGRYIDVLFLGGRWRFVFSASADSNGVSKGVVTVYRISTIPEPRIEEVASFTFNRQGDTDVVPPENNEEPVPMYTPSGALYLALNCIHRGLCSEST